MQGGRDEGQRKEEEMKGEKSEEGMWRTDSLVPRLISRLEEGGE